MEISNIACSITIWRPLDGGVEILREFSAQVTADVDGDESAFGSVSGWIGWDIASEDVADAADAISSDAAMLGAAVAAIQEFREGTHGPALSALLIDRMYLKRKFRGHRLAGEIIDDILSLLRLEPEDTITVLQPEPQRESRGPYPDGPKREQAMRRLCAAYAEQGFEPWADSVVWWKPSG